MDRLRSLLRAASAPVPELQRFFGTLPVAQAQGANGASTFKLTAGAVSGDDAAPTAALQVAML